MSNLFLSDVELQAVLAELSRSLPEVLTPKEVQAMHQIGYQHLSPSFPPGAIQSQLSDIEKVKVNDSLRAMDLVGVPKLPLKESFTSQRKPGPSCFTRLGFNNPADSGEWLARHAVLLDLQKRKRPAVAADQRLYSAWIEVTSASIEDFVELMQLTTDVKTAYQATPWSPAFTESFAGTLRAEHFGRGARGVYGSSGEVDIEGRFYNVQTLFQSLENTLPPDLRTGMISPTAIVGGVKTVDRLVFKDAPIAESAPTLSKTIAVIPSTCAELKADLGEAKWKKLHDALVEIEKEASFGGRGNRQLLRMTYDAKRYSVEWLYPGPAFSVLMGDKLLQIAEQSLLMDIATCLTTDTSSSVVVERAELNPEIEHERIVARFRVHPVTSCNASTYPLVKSLVILAHLPPWEGIEKTERKAPAPPKEEPAREMVIVQCVDA